MIPLFSTLGMCCYQIWNNGLNYFEEDLNYDEQQEQVYPGYYRTDRQQDAKMHQVAHGKHRLPSLNEQDLMAYVFPGMVITKEQPNGCRYGSAATHVLRVLGGKLLKNGMADAYAWDPATYQKKAAKTHPVGFGFGATVESVKWAMEIPNTVQAPTERDILTKFLLEQHGLRLILDGLFFL